MREMRLILAAVILSFVSPLPAAEPPIYVILWFDTEDYILPASDDAAKHIADWLTGEKIKATFKVVGEKARTLERRNRTDVIESLKQHEIGYHSNWHSVPPSPAQYLDRLGWDDGVAEFDRRERPGVEDVARIFGQKPTCYGQPGSSWAPQSFGAMRRWGMPVYLDGGSHINLDNKPLYFCGALALYKIDIVRTRLTGADDLAKTQEQFVAVRKKLQAEGGGIISVFYHPCEFVHKEFWDGVNFRNGADPPRGQWKLPRQKTPDETRAAFDNFESYIRFIERFSDVRFITASQAAQIWRDDALRRRWTAAEIRDIARAVGDEVSFQRIGNVSVAPSETLNLVVDWLEPRLDGRRPPPAFPPLEMTPLGPTEPAERLAEAIRVPLHEFRRAVQDVYGSIHKLGRVPSVVWCGSTSVPPEAFLAAAAKLTSHLIAGGEVPDQVEIRPATLAAAKYVADDSPQLWRWVIFPPGFHAPHVMALAKRQGWTLKPAILHVDH